MNSFLMANELWDIVKEGYEKLEHVTQLTDE